LNILLKKLQIFLILIACLSCSRIDINQEVQPIYNSAYSKFKLGDYNGAIADYSNAIRINPKSDYAYYNRGNAKAYQKNYDDAVADYDKAVELNSTNIDYYNSRGGAKDALEDYAGALADFSKVIKLNPNAAFAYNNRGYDKLCIKDYVGAISDFTKAIGLDSHIVEPYIGCGEVKRALKNYDRAIVDFNKAIELDPRCAPAYRGLGLIQDDLFQLQSALASFQKSLSLNPEQLDIERRVYLIRIRLDGQNEVTKELIKKLYDSNYKNQNAAMMAVGASEPTSLEIEQFLSGVLSESELLRTATNSVWSPKLQKRQLCEAYYYAGMKRLIAGNKSGADDFFKKCIGLGPPNYGEEGYDEYSSAEVELNDYNPALHANH
jgi:tetratricopeptide (TPR) repeat protein